MEQRLNVLQVIKLIGVNLDERLSFRDHVEKLCKILNQKIGLLKKIRSYLPLQESLLILAS